MIPVLLMATLLSALPGGTTQIERPAPPSGTPVSEGGGVGDTASAAGTPEPAAESTVSIPGGRFIPPYTREGRSVTVGSFRLARTPVTVAEYLAFVTDHPAWRRSAVPALFADGRYLGGWEADLEPGVSGEALERPVTGVSWFAARAYCSARGGRLPTTDEWEFAGRASRTHADAFRDPDFTREILGLQQARSARDALPPVGRTYLDARGVWDLHGVVWEWTDDFNNTMLTGSGRDDQGLDRGLFCAAGSLDASDRSDYVAFLRYAFRAGLEGTDGGPQLGFRCAWDMP